jgi:hypothetical protein
METIAYSVLSVGRIRIGSDRSKTYDVDKDCSKDCARDGLSISGIVHASDELLVAGAI